MDWGLHTIMLHSSHSSGAESLLLEAAESDTPTERHSGLRRFSQVALVVVRTLSLSLSLAPLPTTQTE